MNGCRDIFKIPVRFTEQRHCGRYYARAAQFVVQAAGFSAQIGVYHLLITKGKTHPKDDIHMFAFIRDPPIYPFLSRQLDEWRF